MGKSWGERRVTVFLSNTRTTALAPANNCLCFSSGGSSKVDVRAEAVRAGLATAAERYGIWPFDHNYR